MASSCSLLSGLTQFQQAAMTQLNKKLFGLQRLAALLEQLGDAQSSTINSVSSSIAQLPAVASIGQSTYDSLLESCPFLQLPPAGTSTGVTELQSMVGAAYNSLTNQLLNHPYTRMGNLQSEMDRAVSNLGATATINTSFSLCQQNTCGTGAPSATATAQTTQYQKNFVTGNGQVLTPEQSAKTASVNSLVTQLQNLGSTAGITFAAAQAEASFVPATQFDPTQTYSYLDTDGDTIPLSPINLHFEGTWAPGSYAQFDVVSFGGVLFMALNPTTEEPSTT